MATRALGLGLKRALDVLFSLAGLALLWPVLAVVALIVKLDSPGPVFYRGVRTGKGGTPFGIFKFRSMVVDAEKVGGGSTARNDSRITRVGGVLRRYKVDELPQLLNVLIGDMSFVGPRPELPSYTRLYQGEELLILTMRPGITDHASLQFAQLGEVLGDCDADRVYEERVMPVKNGLRVRYVKEWSLLGDLVLVIRTLLRVVRG
ncbi:MAG: sugar transferase [Chthonomonadales bacterium]|nr:sugar transferase [Chthonomonadales bacterium]